MNEVTEQLLASIINAQQVNSKELKELFNQLQEEIKAIKNKGGDTQAVEELKRLIVQQTSEIGYLKDKEIDYTKLVNIKPNKYITIFGGNNGCVNYKWTLRIVAFVICFCIGCLYIPAYFNERAKLEEETYMNKKFVEYYRLTQFRDKGNTQKIDDFIQKIYNSDSVFVKDYNKLEKEYKKEQKRIKLEEERKGLEKQIKELK